MASCTPLPSACLPVGTDTASCRTAALAVFAAQSQNFDTSASRSSVHTDVTYTLAQSVGFSSTDAYWIAAYDETIDLGSFEPRDLNGATVGNGTLKTAVLDGMVRTNVNVGGELFHFIAPRNGGSAIVPKVDGLHPDVEDGNIEGFLVHLRSWAQVGSGSSAVECADGITNTTSDGNRAVGAKCFSQSNGQPAGITAKFTALGGNGVPTFTINSGLQVIVTSTGQTSDKFDEIVGGTTGQATIADARLGIYLHVLADRISHHVCSDTAVLAGPTGSTSAFSVDMSGAQCSQGYHALRHEWETGVSFANVSSANQTSQAALAAVYDELLVFAQLRGVDRASAHDASYRSSVIADLTKALQLSDAKSRVLAISNASCSRGGVAFPGLPACTTSTSAVTAVLVGDAVDPAAQDATLGGCSTGGEASVIPAALVLLFVVGSAYGVRRRRAVA